MAHTNNIRTGMQVLGSDGGMIGRVTGLHGDHIHIQPDAPEPEGDRLIPSRWVARVDDHVHLDRDAALVRDTWGTTEKAGATGPIVHEAAHKGMGRSWIVWLIGAILLLVIIVIGIRGCAYGVDDPDYRDNAKGELSEADRALSGAGAAGAGTAGALNSEVERYLASEEATPRSFRFENLRFDTDSAEIRSENREELAALGRTLAAHPDSRVRIVGYADARGASETNRALGERRAEAVAAALIANGVRPGNIESVSGGEEDPAASNETGEGQAENRRTELVILSR